MRKSKKLVSLVQSEMSLDICKLSAPKVERKFKTLPRRYNGKKGGFTFSLL